MMNIPLTTTMLLCTRALTCALEMYSSTCHACTPLPERLRLTAAVRRIQYAPTAGLPRLAIGGLSCAGNGTVWQRGVYGGRAVQSSGPVPRAQRSPPSESHVDDEDSLGASHVDAVAHGAAGAVG